MFPFRQRLEHHVSHPIYALEESVLADGSVELKRVDVCTKVLPPKENFDLDVLIQAGVNLQQVNCKLINRGFVPLPDSVVSDAQTTKSQTTETSTDKEN